MSIFKVSKGHLSSEVHLPRSKSHANRALILCALSKQSPTLKNLPRATDVTILLDCLQKVGLTYKEKNEEIKFDNYFPACETGNKTLEVGEGGTTARFLAAFLLLGTCEYKLILGKRLKKRPWDEFLHLVSSLGAKADLDEDILTLKGPLQLPPILEVDCSKTTQFATAFQLVAHTFGSKIIPKNLHSSQSYWLLTEEIINNLNHHKIYEIPFDWSSASYPMVFAALNHKIFLPGLRDDPFQADSKLVNVLREFGAIKLESDGIIVEPVRIEKDLRFDVSDCLDLIPSLAFLLAHVKGDHTLIGVKNLIYKESDRLNEIIKLLKMFNRECICVDDTLKIKGKKDYIQDPKKLIMPDDHRMVMVGTLFLLHHSGGEISPQEAVSKSFPNFFEIISF